MINKSIYEKPQSDIVRLPSPILLQSGSGFSSRNGMWDGELFLSPEVFGSEVILPDSIEAQL